MGLAVDTGYLQYTRQRMQAAADAAAIAAALELGAQSGQQVEAGLADAALNGFVDGVSGACVRIEAISGQADAMQAIVRQAVRPLILSAFGAPPVDLHTRAVARAAGGRAALTE